jgi:hypothetical protein
MLHEKENLIKLLQEMKMQRELALVELYVPNEPHSHRVFVEHKEGFQETFYEEEALNVIKKEIFKKTLRAMLNGQPSFLDVGSTDTKKSQICVNLLATLSSDERELLCLEAVKRAVDAATKAVEERPMIWNLLNED